MILGTQNTDRLKPRKRLLIKFKLCPPDTSCEGLQHVHSENNAVISVSSFYIVFLSLTQSVLRIIAHNSEVTLS